MATPSAILPVRLEIPVQINPSDLHHVRDEEDKRVSSKLNEHLVQLTVVDQSGHTLTQGSGFLFSSTQPLIMSCHHLCSAPGPVTIRAMYATDHAEEEVVVVISNPDLDVVVLRGGRCAPTDLIMPLQPAVGDTVYAAGYFAHRERFTQGKISCMTMVGMEVTAHADDGWSGGPVVNFCGNLVGMIQRGVGRTIRQPEVISAGALHVILRINHYPGLRHLGTPIAEGGFPP